MKKPKPPPRSLFKTVAPTVTRVAGDDVEGIKQLFVAMPAPATILEQNVRIIEAAAERAATDERLEHGKKYADGIRHGVLELRQAMKSGDVTIVALKALKLAELWMELRADAMFAASVRRTETQLMALPKTNVTNDQVLRALASEPSDVAAAAKLGVSERWIRSRTSAAERTLARSARKSPKA